MKRILAILLTVVMVCSVFALAVSAEETELENQEIGINFLEKAPVMDGEIASGEYGKYPVHSFKLGQDNPGFKISDCYELTDDPNLAIDFYAGWDADNLYMAWKVNTKYDSRIPEGIADGYMYEYCCVQFILTTGAPNKNEIKYQTAQWSGDYLEVGLCLKDDGLSYKVCWSQPLAANGGLTLSDWEYAGSRNGDVTVYEVRLPWDKTGVQVVGTDAQFGLTYAVGAQEQFTNVAMGMVEYQDAILFGKHADSAAIVTMEGGDVEQKEVVIAVTDPEKAPEGKLPAGLKPSAIAPNKVDTVIGGENCLLISKVNNLASYGVTWAYLALLRPEGKIEDVDGYYTVLETVQGAGEVPVFQTEFKKGDLIVAAHSDGGNGLATKTALQALELGSKVYVFGFLFDDQGELGFKYKNRSIIPIVDPATELFGTWYNDETEIVFNEDKNGTKGETAFKYTVDQNGTLKIDGKKTDWKIEDGVLTLGSETFTKVTAANLDDLNGLIALGEAKDAAEFTEESFAALTEALAAAKELADKTDLDSRNQAEIDAAAQALNAALEALEAVEPVTSEEESEAESVAEESKEESKAEESKEESKAEEGGLSTGAIVGIVAAAVVVIGGGAAAAVVLGKKKK